MITSWKPWIWRILLVVLFVLVLAYVLFLANGYQYDFLGNQIRRTGIVEITYTDPQARVYLDGQQLKGTLPFSANNVLPGKYHLVVGREGYWDYSLDVQVREDLITSVSTVFLVPMDLLSNSKPVQSFPGDSVSGTTRILLADGYVWQQNDEKLRFARLRPVLAPEDFTEVVTTDAELDKVGRSGRYMVINYQDGQRYLLDPADGQAEKIVLPENYLPADGQWIYFRGNVLAAMNDKFDKVLWATQPAVKEEITSVRYYSLAGRDFLAVDYGGKERRGQLFELKSGLLWPLDEGRITSLNLNDRGNPVYVKEDREIWQYDALKKTGVQLARFQSPVEIISADPDIYHSGGLFLLKINNSFLMADREFINVRELFKDITVTGVDLPDRKTVYFLKGSDEKTAPQGDARLFYYNLEN
jgi:hypothetical protein